MARTKKTTDTGDESVIVQLHPEAEPPAAVEEPAPPAPADEQPRAEDTAEAPEQSRGRGPGLNRVELIGRIAKGPDVHVTPTSGTHVAYFRVATNGRDSVEFHQCTAFGKTAEFIGEYLSTGRLVYLDGRLQTRSYTDSDGIPRWVTSIAVNRLQVLDQRRPAEQ
jgi:single-strand DNA-binding protein